MPEALPRWPWKELCLWLSACMWTWGPWPGQAWAWLRSQRSQRAQVRRRLPVCSELLCRVLSLHAPWPFVSQDRRWLLLWLKSSFGGKKALDRRRRDGFGGLTRPAEPRCTVHTGQRAALAGPRAAARRLSQEGRHQPELPRCSPLTGLASRGHRVKAVLGRVLYQGIVA